VSFCLGNQAFQAADAALLFLDGMEGPSQAGQPAAE
jgi:hypothetical protein